MGKVLVVAFDSLDYELIEEFDLENIKLSEFGKIDNYTGIEEIKTSELFASFITGKTAGEHGITGLSIENSRIRRKIVEDFPPEVLRKNVRGMEYLNQLIETAIKLEKWRPDKSDLEMETLFEEIEGSRAICVPSYNTSPTFVIKASVEMMLKGYSSQEIVDWWRTREFRYRKNELMRELESDIIGARPLLMAHFHFVDIYQHHFGDKNLGNFDKDKLRKVYLEMDELAAEIKEKAEEQGYDHIIFMSDHGLPTETEHNKNAFYSSSKPLFEGTPKIVDFYNRIKELIEE